MSKLSFRARALDATKPMPIFMAEELPDLQEFSAINRAVPQMPSGMEKEEESEHHLQRAICAGILIPTPDVTEVRHQAFHDKIYPPNYRQPRQLIHLQPLLVDQDIPDYDMDSDDELWLQSQDKVWNLTPYKFESIMDKLEKHNGHTVITVNEAKVLFNEKEELVIAVYDYWLNKRLSAQHPLILTVRTEQKPGIPPNSPYLAFRRRTEKMQTRKNRKNDEASYEKMTKLRRDLHRAVDLLALLQAREEKKKQYVKLTMEIFEKRFKCQDFNGELFAEASAIRTSRPAFTPIFHNHYTNQNWPHKTTLKDEALPRKEKRQYKKRKHKQLGSCRAGLESGADGAGVLSSDEETLVPQLSPESDVEDEGPFAFKRAKSCSYYMPRGILGDPCSMEFSGHEVDPRQRFLPASLAHPKRFVGLVRRRIGRGGRMILDRVSATDDDFWRTTGFTIMDDPRDTKGNEETTTAELVGDLVTDNFNSSALRTEFKTELQDELLNNRTRDSEISYSESEKPIFKMEVDERDPTTSVITQESTESSRDEEATLRLLRFIQDNSLHFRPKTPPENYEPPCYMLPADNMYLNSANTSFQMEIQPLESPSTLIDTSTFLTEPFTFDFDSIEEVPVTDTRQSQSLSTTPPPTITTATTTTTILNSSDKNVQTGINLNVNVGINTLNSSVNNFNIDNNSNSSNITTTTTNTNNNNNGETYESPSPLAFDDSADIFDDFIFTNSNNTILCESVIGNSKFFVSDLDGGRYFTSSDKSATSKFVSTYDTTLPSPKLLLNSCVNSATSTATLTTAISSEVVKSLTTTTTTTAPSSNTNGLLPQLGFDVSSSRTKNNKLYAYSSGVGYSNASSGTLSLHTSAHSLTLNSHSANILEIPLESNSEKLINSSETLSSSGSGGVVGSSSVGAVSPPTTNNKNKTIVRKNFVMEVT